MSRKTTLSFLVTFFKMLENTLDNKKKSRFPIAVILACIGLINFGNAQAQNVDVTIPSGGFEIDANLQSNSPINTGDWVQGPGSGGHVLNNIDGTPVDPATTGFFRDEFNSASDNTFSQGKAGDDPNSWKWTTSSASPSKGDINNAMYHIGKDALNNQWIFIASDRRTTTGTSYIDFEFFQNPLTTNSGGFTTAGPDGGRTVDDILLTMEYGNGGSAATVYFYLWEDTGGGNYGWVFQPTTGITAFAQTNTGIIDVPFSAFGNTTYSPLQFVEGAINLTSVFGQTGDPCFGVNIKTLLVKTKNSTAATASLNDFIGPLPVALSFGNAAIIYVNPVCSDSAPVEVTQTGVSGGTYSASPSGLDIDSGSGLIDVSSSDVGIYTVTYSFTSNGCSKTAETDFTILALPNTPTANASEQPGCDITTGTISVEIPNPNWTYTISGPNSFTQDNQTGIFSGLLPGNYTVNVTNLDSCTSGPSQVIEIIEFNDSEDPSITCAADQSQPADAGVCNAAVTVIAPATSDNCEVATITNDFNGTADASGTYPVGTTVVTWTVTDVNDNTNTCVQNIIVTDDQ
ncbi:MAG: HYR domain-containing protein, partial [Gillisia sp.]|nr:HYR domain-containing protein [Gillisia sp.]